MVIYEASGREGGKLCCGGLVLQQGIGEQLVLAVVVVVVVVVVGCGWFGGGRDG